MFVPEELALKASAHLLLLVRVPLQWVHAGTSSLQDHPVENKHKTDKSGYTSQTYQHQSSSFKDKQGILFRSKPMHTW